MFKALLIFAKTRNSSFLTTRESSLSRDFLWITLVLWLFFGLYLAGNRPLLAPDEGRYAEIPREMLALGDYITPHLNYLKYFEKPPLSYWMEAGAIRLLGLHEWSLRIVTVLMATLGCLVVYAAGRKLYNRRTGLLACFMLATSALYFMLSGFVSTDMPLTVWVSLSLLFFIMGTCELVRKKQCYYFWGMYICAALAVLTKGLIGIVFPGIIIFCWLCIARQWKHLSAYCIPTGILLFLCIAMPWHLLVQHRNPEFFYFYFVEQHVLRYLTDYAGREKGAWFFPLVTLVGFFPWTCFLLGGFKNIFFRHRDLKKTAHFYATWCKENPKTVFIGLWAIVLFIFFSFSKSLLLSYALPLMPPFALLVAHYIDMDWAATDVFSSSHLEKDARSAPNFLSPIVRKEPEPYSIRGACRADDGYPSRPHTLIRNGFCLLAILGFLIGLSAVVLRNSVFHPPILLITAMLCSAVFLLSSWLYWRVSIISALVMLMLGTTLSLTLGNQVFMRIDDRSVKPLALILNALKQADMEVVSYHGYYQDLPAYIGKRITVVGLNYIGELIFGIQHQDASAWMIDDATFWARWRHQPHMYMVMDLGSYRSLNKEEAQWVYPIGQTSQNILLSNQSQN